MTGPIAAPAAAPARPGQRLGTVTSFDGDGVWTLQVRDYELRFDGRYPAPGGPLLQRRGVSSTDQLEWNRILAAGGYRTNEAGWVPDGAELVGGPPGWVAVVR